jgi:uncharacterized damage-inducible protein DinB
MPEPPSTLPTFYKGWHDYQGSVVKALAPLSAEQLDLRAAPHLRSVAEIVLHMIGARARWLHNLIGEGDEEFAALATWDRPGMPARSAAELVSALETSWRVLQDALVRWTPAEWEQTYEGEEGDPPTFTRQWVVWHLVEHDLHHGGELSLTLGIHGIAALDL